MTYNPTIWVDDQTPVNAENMNKVEFGIDQQESDINILSEYVGELDERVTEDIRVLSEYVGDMSANDITYTTDYDGNITSVKDALDKLLYTPLSISLSSSRNICEVGEIVSSVNFNWIYNKNIVNQKFNGVELDKNFRNYTYNTPFNSNKSFTLAANDGKSDFNKSISVSFSNGRYWGVSNSIIYDNAFIKTLNKELNESRIKTFTVNCGEGQHIFYCFPSKAGIPTFTVGGFSGGFNKVSTINFANNFGFIESYDIWKSTNSNLGNTTVVVG